MNKFSGKVKKERKTVNLEQYKDMLNLIADNEQQKVKEIVLFVADDQIIPLQLNLIEKATDINFIVLLSKEYKDTDVISFFKDLKNVRVKQLDVSITAWPNAQLLRLEDKVIAVSAANGKINDNNIGDFVVPGVYYIQPLILEVELYHIEYNLTEVQGL